MCFAEAMLSIPLLFLLLVLSRFDGRDMSDITLLGREISGSVIVSATLGISSVILAESYVSFLGLGVQPPTASWGNMIERAMERMDTAWWLWFFPGVFILLTVLSINFIGDGLRDALDPYSTR